MSKHGILSNLDGHNKVTIKVEDSFRITIQWSSGSAASATRDCSCTILLADLFASSPTEEGKILLCAGFNCLALGTWLLLKAK